MGQILANYDVFAYFFLTIRLAVFSAIGAFVLGTIIAIFRLAPVGFLRGLGRFYVEVIRNTPLTLIMVSTLLVFHSNLLIPMIGADTVATRNFNWAVVALAIYHSAFVCEALRSGVNTVPVGQAEAARSMGLTFTQSLRHVIFPQALRGAIVPLTNVFIALTKNTTVAAVIGVAEIAYLTSIVIENQPGLILSMFLIVALGFVILTLPIGLLGTYLGRKLAVQR
ncbi:glutamate transport system permease protein [Kineosphaera limosa]|uniref:Glutamate ABC transporter permease protein n=1 Tax=Kineosphaera limosa NBRC 100340 TaxID=1184609 RepID=K6WN23_9MICO|nr:amino acid ABC transporter permease [Kineosphaera limosa]NYE01471.1 glutamate transport system permease protein [Kineosphaera limosa]GAB95216.1 glutamate ABC transporter permease protein [Kineosphaera limosa NBRC 100340]